jgi:uncharacterized protein YdcH (DUF465 family)
MNARTNTQTQTNNSTTTSRTIKEKPTPEQVENLAQQLLELKELEDGFKQLQTKLREDEGTPTTNPKKQVINLKKQILQTQPKLRGSTATHVGQPRVGPFTRRPRDPIDLRGQHRNQTMRQKPLAQTFVQTSSRGGRVHTTMGSPPKRSLQSKAIRGNSPAIENRVASEFRVGKSGAPIDIQSRLKKKSPWFASIMDPLANGGVKIPDPVGTDTGTYQHVENVSVGVNVNGIAGLRVCSPYINRYDAGDPVGSNYQTTTNTGVSGGPSSLSNLAWGAGAATQLMQAFARIPEMMQSVAQSHRVVSAWVVAQPEVSTLSDAGEMCAFVKPFDCNPYSVDYSTLQSQWDTALMPVNQHKPLAARHYPLSSDYFPFNGNSTQPEEGQEPPTISYQDFMDPNIAGQSDNGTGVIPWEFGVVCTGMTPNTGVVRFTIVVNYEYIPKTSTGSISGATKDRNDVTESNLVSSWVSDCPVTGVVPQSTVSRAPAACSIPEEPSGFGMMFNVIEEMLPLMGKAAAMIL